MDDEEYRLLARIERGDSVFRPSDSTPDAKRSFQATVARLLALRMRGWIRVPAGRISVGRDGMYILAGPSDLTPDGVKALEQDRRLGPRADT